jgi:bacillithiol biosynthesis cysteine-adding enzyme BshC
MLSGVPAVKAHCLPFSQIPHTTRLFIDYVSHFNKVQSFFPRYPNLSEWLQDETSVIRYDSERRRRVANVLDRQNRSWGASPQTLTNLDRFRNGAVAVVTGQQVGLFGGPAFSIYKALSAVKLAAQASAAGMPTVPIFWVATEDHDLAEVNHTQIPASDGTLQLLTVPSHSVPDAPVGTITFDDEINPVVQSAVELLGTSPVSEALPKSYRPGETLGSAFARLLASLFGEWGVILIDPSERELHAIVEPLYRSTIDRAAELDDQLLARGTALEAAGYHQQVKVTPSSTLLFTLRNGGRVPIQRRSNGSPETMEFLIGQEKVSKDELLRQIATTPHDFNPNVLLRPVVQDYLLPTLAYVGGAAEVAYFAQAAVVYQALLGRVTPILPRFSATLVEPKAQRLLEKYKLPLTDVFQGPDHLREKLADQALPAELQSSFDQTKRLLEQSFAQIQTALGKLDPTLVEAASHAGSKMQYQLDQLRARAARAELRQSEVTNRHADLLSQLLFPNKTLQEREIAATYFLSRYGKELLGELYNLVHTDCHDHQVVEL